MKIGKKKGTLAAVFFSTTFVFVSVYLEAGGLYDSRRSSVSSSNLLASFSAYVRDVPLIVTRATAQEQSWRLPPCVAPHKITTSRFPLSTALPCPACN